MVLQSMRLHVVGFDIMKDEYTICLDFGIILLEEEFRVLPQNHRAKEDKLEVKKMALHAMKQAVVDLEKYLVRDK
ncbi:hypothetical protein F0562_005973 [Nyssa sinensis]|uniref:Uncharacterized protein n=1 Tax=Nyssa sinensis TaxID=561372 RepID=A0A5J5ALY5_9ASTE|nr:hypothetical protein F0562_005973 [Nyssa sinensis]